MEAGRLLLAWSDPVTPKAFCRAGEAERAKAAVHGVMGLGAGVCLAYNAVAWTYRREMHLAVNTAIYLAAVVFEARKVAHHLTSHAADTDL